MAESICYLGLGSNLGDRELNLSRALELLAEKVQILQGSSIYETDPWGVTDQPKFLNRVVKGSTLLDAPELLRFLKQIEKTLGRIKTYRYGPRLIDLDILIFGDLLLQTPALQIPHPHLTERAFVLVPLAELAPKLVLPGTLQTIAGLLGAVDTSGVRLYRGAA